MTHSKKSLLELEQSGKYGSVIIASCGCDISTKLSTQYFSFEHALPLPLPGCTAKKCTCEYRGIIDRRLNDRAHFSNEKNRHIADKCKEGK